MAKGIRVELTDDQIFKLQPIMDEIRKLDLAGTPGMAVAQIYVDHLACGWLDHDQGAKVQAALGNAGAFCKTRDDRT
jgi:hypothetical protein